MSCEHCERFQELLQDTEGIIFPNPLDYSPEVKVLLVSWAPPGKPKAVEGHHFFHNPRSPDRLRSRIFNSLSERKPHFRLNPKKPEQSLSRFYELGLYLVPTIFRRINNDAKPTGLLVQHSSQIHLQKVLMFTVQRQKILRVVLLGETPSRAFANLFEKQEAGRAIASAMRAAHPVEIARKLTSERPLGVEVSASASIEVWISNWPRGEGYYNLSSDIVRAMDWTPRR